MSKDYYDKSSSDATDIVSTAQSIGVIPQFFIVIGLGYIYDIFGRKYVIFTLFVLNSIAVFLLPTVAPNENLFIAVSIGISIAVAPILNSPLLQDYVEIESRGKAQGFSVMGLALGIIISLAVMVQFTKNLDPK